MLEESPVRPVGRSLNREASAGEGAGELGSSAAEHARRAVRGTTLPRTSGSRLTLTSLYVSGLPCCPIPRLRSRRLMAAASAA